MTISRSTFFSVLAGVSALGAPRAAKPPWDPLPPPERAVRALVLSGAGARGAYEAGALKWLYRDIASADPPFEVVCGSSAGAINAAFAALGTVTSIAQLETLWHGMAQADVIRLQPAVQDIVDAAVDVQQASRLGFPSNLHYFNRARASLAAAGSPEDIAQLGGASSDAGVRALVRQYPLDITNLRSSLLISATNITRMASDAFYRFAGSDAAAATSRFLARVQPRPRLAGEPAAPTLLPQLPLHHELTQDNVEDALVASAAMPGVFKPVPVRHAETGDMALYVDGGVVNNLSVSLAADAGAWDITILTGTATNELPHNEATLPGVLQEAYALMHEQILQDDIGLAIAKNLLGRNRDLSWLNPTVQAYLRSLQASAWRPLVLRVIRPRTPLAVVTMGFNHQDGIDAAFAQGYADAQSPFLYSMT
ncbi:MAG TPA: patatin-like phospholipase family protein [Candidatus Acidoferrales bacterium]|nr:patatin-like phospholipase family protein [Candidatus Acidoferrales bacterium]